MCFLGFPPPFPPLPVVLQAGVGFVDNGGQSFLTSAALCAPWSPLPPNMFVRACPVCGGGGGAKGLYYFQIHAWLQHFPAEQLLVLKSEDYFSDPEAIVTRITDFIKGTRASLPTRTVLLWGWD